MNLCTVPTGGNGSVSFAGETVKIGADVVSGRQELVLGLRPESLELAADGLPARVEVVEEVGADAWVFCVADVAGEATKLVARTESRHAPERGERVTLRGRPDEAHVFDPETGARLERS
jgi:multiple sugar transport system ATP-binding protein